MTERPTPGRSSRPRRRSQAATEPENERSSGQENLVELVYLAAAFDHEVRSPLNAALVQVALAGKRGAVAETAAIKSALDRVEEVLEKYRHALLRFRPSDDPASVEAAIGDALAAEAGVAEARGVQVRRGPSDPTLPRVSVPPGAMEAALAAVIANAIDASRSGQSVLVAAAAEPGGVAVTVRDNGQGITASELPRVFKIGFSTRPGRRGTGLPLAKTILTVHGGRLELASIEGGGTTCTLHMPAATGESRSQ